MILHNSALSIFHRTLAAIDVEKVTRNYLHRAGNNLIAGDETVDLAQISRIIVIGIGKASVAPARVIEELLSDRLADGLIATNAVVGDAPRRLRVILGGHPLPNQASLEAAQSALAILRVYDSEETLVLFLITGGGSSLFEQPVDSTLTLADLQDVNRELVGCGAVIREMNIVRRSLSAVKGGRLAEAAPRSRQISLYVSDVNRGDLASVASGPTMPTETTLDDFRRVIDKYHLLDRFPSSVARLIREDRIPPMPRSRGVTQRSHHLLLDNYRALAEARCFAEELGFTVEIADDLIEGEVEELARKHIERLEGLRRSHTGQTVCLISGGEAICPVRGGGRGGRNQEFVLRTAVNLYVQGDVNTVVLSAGTDGIDGNSPAAGAIADARTIQSAQERGFAPADYLKNSDSFTFLANAGATIVTGPTGNNVRDLRLLLGQ